MRTHLASKSVNRIIPELSDFRAALPCAARNLLTNQRFLNIDPFLHNRGLNAELPKRVGRDDILAVKGS